VDLCGLVVFVLCVWNVVSFIWLLLL